MDLSAIALLAAGLAVLLLLVFMLRLQKRFQMLALDLERMHKTQKEMRLDARSRIDEASGALTAMEQRLEGVEAIKDLAPRIGDVEASVSKLRPSVEAAGRRGDEIGKVVTEATSRLAEAEGIAKGAKERAGQVDASLAETRARLEKVEKGLESLEENLDERFEKMQQRYLEVGMAIRKMQDEDTVEDVSGEAIAEAMAAEMHARRIAGATATARGASARAPAPGKKKASKDSQDDEAGDPLPPPLPKPTPDDPEGAGGLSWVLIMVIGLAALTVALHFLRTGH